jgi:hypothetical protein
VLSRWSLGKMSRRNRHDTPVPARFLFACPNQGQFQCVADHLAAAASVNREQGHDALDGARPARVGAGGPEIGPIGSDPTTRGPASTVGMRPPAHRLGRPLTPLSLDFRGVRYRASNADEDAAAILK